MRDAPGVGHVFDFPEVVYACHIKHNAERQKKGINSNQGVSASDIFPDLIDAFSRPSMGQQHLDKTMYLGIWASWLTRFSHKCPRDLQNQMRIGWLGAGFGHFGTVPGAPTTQRI